MNVLLLSAGRRTSLAHLLGAALDAHGGQLHVADMDGLAPTVGQHPRAHRLPRTTADDYDATLMQLVEDAAISAILPCIDADLVALSRLQPQLTAVGCHAVVSDGALIDIAIDKASMAEVFSAAGVSVAPWWVPADGPIAAEFGADCSEFVVKPRCGAGSGHMLIVDADRLDAAISIVPDPIVQPRLWGTELSVDAFFDFSSTLRHYVPRERVKTVGGESIQGRTVDDAAFADWLREVFRVMGAHGARGPQTVQLFLSEAGPVLSEINPRFAGGFPLANRAGGRYADWVVDLLAGSEPQIVLGEYERGVFMTRSFVEAYTTDPAW